MANNEFEQRRKLVAAGLAERKLDGLQPRGQGPELDAPLPRRAGDSWLFGWERLDGLHLLGNDQRLAADRTILASCALCAERIPAARAAGEHSAF